MKTARRLAAIMFTDIQGYTALMQSSEANALKLRETHRKIFENETRLYHGEIIQYYGDGTLSVFNSVVDAVHCAIAMQRRFVHEGKIPVRIGIHEGDIMISEQDIIGDSVNLASRIESLGVPGSVMISEKVYDEIKNQEDVKVSYIDAFHLKNVKEPVKVYAISNEGLIVPQKRDIQGKLTKSRPSRLKSILGVLAMVVIVLLGWIFGDVFGLRGGKEMFQSIVVLPFDNYTGDEEMDYFVQGMHASLIGDLGKISALRVVSPTTARSYAGSGKSLPEIAKELDVDVVLEASVHCLGDSICIQPRLTGVEPDEKQLWIQDFYKEKSQIINLYHQLSKEISGIINVSLTPEEEIQFADQQEIDPEAYELYLKGQFNLDRVSKNSLESAFQYFQLAIDIEPEWADPYAGLASVLAYQKQMDLIAYEEANHQMVKFLNKALELNPNSAEVYHSMAIHSVWTEYNWEKAEKEFKKCIELNPNHAMNRMFYAHLLTILRHTDEALEQAALAAEIDPKRPLILGLQAVVLIEAGQYKKALEQAEKGLKIEPYHPFVNGQYGWAQACLGNSDFRYEAWKQMNINTWERYGVTTLLDSIYYNEGWVAVQKEAIRLNEELYNKDGIIDHYSQGERYFYIGNYDKAVDIWENLALPNKNPNLPYISCHSFYDKMKDHKGYQNLLKRMGLPL
jgi:adenylate cyclase